ncbi:MAG TPA: hypothetical protein VGH34_16730 [Vicinamibacterales bacterium]
MPQSRRQFIRTVPTFGAFLMADQAGSKSLDWPAPPNPAAMDDSFPALHPALAKEMVGVSHSSLARVKELLQQHPALAKASWDWGYGDAETALGAASHVGQRAIAELLLETGAPPTLFSATMLGQLDVVKALMTSTPGLQRLRGPHSLSLMVHARAGGPPADAVVKYLEALGDAGLSMPDEPLSAEERARLDGRYVFGDRPRDVFIVSTKPNQVAIERLGATSRTVMHLGQLEFTAPGAPAVRIRFERDGASITALTLSDPDLVVRAQRRG